MSEMIPIDKKNRYESNLCKISVFGDKKDEAKRVQFTFSHEAVVGFATELIWLYEDIDDVRRVSIETHPLKVDPAPSQAIGFFLTPDSPVFLIKVNNEPKTHKEECAEEIFELSDLYDSERKNLVKIDIYDAEGHSLNHGLDAVVMHINKCQIRELALGLWNWAAEHREGNGYLLTTDYVETDFRCTDLGTAGDYDEKFRKK